MPGTDVSGRSPILSDAPTPARVTLPAFTVNDIWRLDALPVPVGADGTLGAAVERR
ncbi:hypothetical protein [Nocardia sp. alder85J]|uniref:hypothetical protein n=1 Tax=Nocardia sp. alder85J TaxID=2862949 RepID=UPI001CD5D5D2|nr:hypothetical protein [Nocardia sp. alder85J]MCX4095558.1 hypothetical protein [Nocardia sp. alder85J]